MFTSGEEVGDVLFETLEARRVWPRCSLPAPPPQPIVFDATPERSLSMPSASIAVTAKYHVPGARL